MPNPLAAVAPDIDVPHPGPGGPMARSVPSAPGLGVTVEDATVRSLAG